MKRFFVKLFFAGLMLMSVNGYSEDYSTAAGIRLGGVSSGLTVKHFLNSKGALEGILSWGYHSFLITGLYEWQQPIPNAEGLGWFFGGGLHVGFYNDGYYYHYNHYYHGNKGYYYYSYDPEDRRAALGLDFIIGLEYKFKNTPLTLGLDAKPYFDFADGSYFYWDGALTARYTF